MERIKTHSKPLFAPAGDINVRIVVFALISLLLMVVDQRFQAVDTLRNGLALLVYPLQYVAQTPRWLSSSIEQNLAGRQALLEEIKRLQDYQLLANVQLQKLAALEQENQRLRELLQSSAELEERVLIAELLTVDFDPYRHRILLNKGARHGVKVGQPLLAQQGVVGQVARVNPLTASAILITDPHHALPVQIERNGLRTLAQGSGTLNQLELLHLPNDNDVRVGDVLSTSGLGGRFPRGYPVARVTRVEFDPGRPFARIVAVPTVQLDRIREVLLVLSERQSARRAR